MALSRVADGLRIRVHGECGGVSLCIGPGDRIDEGVAALKAIGQHVVNQAGIVLVHRHTCTAQIGERRRVSYVVGSGIDHLGCGDVAQIRNRGSLIRSNLRLYKVGNRDRRDD